MQTYVLLSGANRIHRIAYIGFVVNFDDDFPIRQLSYHDPLNRNTASD
jgi:hypothetical protein